MVHVVNDIDYKIGYLGEPDDVIMCHVQILNGEIKHIRPYGRFLCSNCGTRMGYDIITTREHYEYMKNKLNKR